MAPFVATHKVRCQREREPDTSTVLKMTVRFGPLTPTSASGTKMCLEGVCGCRQLTHVVEAEEKHEAGGKFSPTSCLRHLPHTRDSVFDDLSKRVIGSLNPGTIDLAQVPSLFGI